MPASNGHRSQCPGPRHIPPHPSRIPRASLRTSHISAGRGLPSGLVVGAWTWLRAPHRLGIPICRLHRQLPRAHLLGALVLSGIWHWEALPSVSGSVRRRILWGERRACTRAIWSSCFHLRIMLWISHSRLFASLHDGSKGRESMNACELGAGSRELGAGAGPVEWCGARPVGWRRPLRPTLIPGLARSCCRKGWLGARVERRMRSVLACHCGATWPRLG